MNKLLSILSAAREASHSALAVIGAAAGAQAVIVNLLAVLGVHVSAMQASNAVGVAGAVVLAVSKGIDSLNNAIVQKAALTATVSLAPTSPPPPPAAGVLTDVQAAELTALVGDVQRLVSGAKSA